jgi:hypothetical protein
MPLRTADVAETGEVNLLARVSLPFEPGAHVRRSDGSSSRVSAFGGIDGGGGAWPLLMALASVEVAVAVGVADDCEIGFLGGLAGRIGGELRCAAVDQRDGDDLTLALSAAGGIQHWQLHPWARVGVETGKHTGVVAPFVAAHVSFGRERHSWEGGLLGGAIQRDEVRVHLAAGAGLAFDEWRGSGAADLTPVGLIAATGFWVAWADHELLESPGLHLGREQSRTYTRRFRRVFGTALLAGFAAVPAD